MLDDDAYRERHGVENPNSELIRELVASGAQVILCGQTAAGRGIPTDRLADGVQLSLSAMTALGSISLIVRYTSRRMRTYSSYQISPKHPPMLISGRTLWILSGSL